MINRKQIAATIFTRIPVMADDKTNVITDNP